MLRILLALAITLVCVAQTWANEIIGLRSTVQKEKTRVVFDFKDKPDFKLQKIAPYKVVLDVFGIPAQSPVPKITGAALGELVDDVKISRIKDGVSYLFVLKWNLDPVTGTLAPQGNYKNYRIYLDFLNSRISGAPRGNDKVLPVTEKTSEIDKSQKVEDRQPKPAPSVIKSDPKDILNGKSKEVAEIKVLTPEEAIKHKEEMHRNNEKNMQKIREQELAKKKAEEQAKKNALLEKQKAEAAEKARQAELKKKQEAEKLQIARAKAEAEARKQSEEALKKAEAEKKALAALEAKKKAEEEKMALAALEDRKKSENEKKKLEQEKKKDLVKVQDEKHKEEQSKQNGKCVNSGLVIIAIDAGHGGKDPGAIGTKAKEKEVTLAISKALYKKINATEGMKAILTRSGDYFVELDRRSEIARTKNADILISIHADAAVNKSAKGASVLVLNNDRAGRENNKMLKSTGKHDNLLGGASEVLEEAAANGESDLYIKNMIIDLTSGKSRDTGYDLANRIIKRLSGFVQMHKSRPDERSLAVLKAPDIPSILVETGFISNVNEETLLKNAKYQNRIAEAIYLALKDHLSDPRYKVNKCR